jgi:polyhydroxybutyrate depolymerase
MADAMIEAEDRLSTFVANCRHREKGGLPMNLRMLRLTVLVAALLAGGMAAEGSTSVVPSVPGLYALTFDVSNGDQRAYLLYLPPGYDPARVEPFELIAMFHGGGQSAVSFATNPGMLRLHELVEAQNRIVVFLQGSLGTSVFDLGVWNFYSFGRDDVLYTQELLDHFAVTLNIDEARVFAAGFSMGGRFVHELGARDPGRFRAIAVVEGYYGTTVIEPVPPPVGTMLPVFIVHGDADHVVEIAGGNPAPLGGTYLSAQDAYDRWYANDSCTTLSYTIYLAGAEYLTTACQFGTFRNVLKFVTVYGHGHSWPVASDGYDASNSMLLFFDQQ